MRSDHRIAEATTFTQFCWNCAWTRTYQSSGYRSVNTGRLESHSSLHQTYWTQVLARPVGIKFGMTQMYQTYYCLSSVMVPATGSRLRWYVWSHRRSVAGFPSSFMFTLAVTELKKVDQHKMQWNRRSAARQQNLRILASNISKYFQNTLKQQNYTKWNSKYWLPGLRLESKAYLNNIPYT